MARGPALGLGARIIPRGAIGAAGTAPGHADALGLHLGADSARDIAILIRKSISSCSSFFIWSSSRRHWSRFRLIRCS